MGKRDIILTVDERWYDALAHRLRGMDTTVEEQLGGCFNEMLNQLPAPEYEKISSEIWAEDQRQRRAEQAAGRLSVFRVTQDGRTNHMLTKGCWAMDTMQTVTRLRSYLLVKPNSSERFAQVLHSAMDIAPEVFRDYVDELRQGTGQVVAALDIDLDRGEFSTMAGADGWQTYTIRDVCMAAWRANRKEDPDWDKRLAVLAQQLEGKEIATPERLTEQEGQPQEELEAAPFDGPEQGEGPVPPTGLTM